MRVTDSGGLTFDKALHRCGHGCRRGAAGDTADILWRNSTIGQTNEWLLTAV
jgi:hypothetical protein